MLNALYSLHWNVTVAREYPGFHERLRDMKKERHMSRDEWLALRDRRLRRMLGFARDHVPYYRGAMDAAGIDLGDPDIVGQLRRLPVLDKEIIRNRQSDLVADNVRTSDLLENASGGSTGAPVKFYQDREYWMTYWAAITVMRDWWGVRPFDRCAAVWGADREFHELSWKERLYFWRLRQRTMNAFRMSDETLLEYCRMLRKWRPPYVIGYSSALEAMANCAKSHGITDLRFKAIRSSAEMLWPHQRRLIEEVFQSPVYNTYGSREINCLAAECAEGRRIHMMSAWRFVEITDEDGRPVPDGEAGYIVITDLCNFGMPFIRYRNEDVGRISNEPCPCGRPAPVITELLGRTTDIITAPTGELIHGEFFTHLFYGRNDIKRFQVHQVAIDRFIIRYVSDGAPPRQFFDEIVRKIRARLGGNVQVEVQRCEEIPIPRSGKHRFTLSDVKPNWSTTA